VLFRVALFADNQSHLHHALTTSYRFPSGARRNFSFSVPALPFLFFGGLKY